VLDALFAGVDVIGESDAGKTFCLSSGRLLTDPEQSSSLGSGGQRGDQPSIRAMVLDARERRFLLRLTRLLMEKEVSVHDVLQTLARSLKGLSKVA